MMEGKGISFSALIAIMFIGIGIKNKNDTLSRNLSIKYGKIWIVAEVFLFVLVGATVNIGYIGKIGFKAVAIILGALICRMLGVYICVLGTKLNTKERFLDRCII